MAAIWHEPAFDIRNEATRAFQRARRIGDDFVFADEQQRRHRHRAQRLIRNDGGHEIHVDVKIGSGPIPWAGSERCLSTAVAKQVASAITHWMGAFPMPVPQNDRPG
jgi:hypothetical protein